MPDAPAAMTAVDDLMDAESRSPGAEPRVAAASLGLVLIIARRLRKLTEKVNRVLPDFDSGLPSPGTPVPEFRARTATGVEVIPAILLVHDGFVRVEGLPGLLAAALPVAGVIAAAVFGLQGRLTAGDAGEVAFDDVWFRYFDELPWVLKGVSFRLPA